MELQYVKLMEANNLDESGLSDKAKVGVKELKKALAGVALSERNGRTVSKSVVDKIEMLDENIVSLIERDLAAKNDAKAKADADAKAKADAEAAKAKEDAEKAKSTQKTDNVEEVKAADPKGVKIDQDLAEALKNGKNKVSLAELKSISKTAYDIIFDSYEDGGQNGVETSHYSVIETEKEVFTISKL